MEALVAALVGVLMPALLVDLVAAEALMPALLVDLVVALGNVVAVSYTHLTLPTIYSV